MSDPSGQWISVAEDFPARYALRSGIAMFDNSFAAAGVRLRVLVLGLIDCRMGKRWICIKSDLFRQSETMDKARSRLHR